MSALFDLSGKTALVTGASRGIGEALAVGLAGAGANIIAAARRVDSLDAVAARVTALGRRCERVAVDVSDRASIEQAFAAIDGLGARPSILINNAGMEQVRASLDVDEALWDRILDTNLKGAFFVAQGFAKRLAAAGEPGAIVNLGSLTSAVGVPTAAPYTASKSGLLGMTRALAVEWAAHGVRVNALGPGYFQTALTAVFYESAPWREAMLAKIPAGRFGDLGDLVGATVFMASDASVYMTGQIIYVDGGYLASI